MLSICEQTALTLKMEDGSETQVIVKEIQTNFITLQTAHIDFIAVTE
jgi:ribosomal protein L25 (general stress protein Ctc)